MFPWMDAVMILLMLSNLMLLAASRITLCVRIVAVQGVALSLLPVAAAGEAFSPAAWTLAVTALILKGVVFPGLLLRALRDANVRREIEPFVGHTFSILVGVAVLSAMLWLNTRLALPSARISGLLAPTGFFTAFVGVFLIATRKKALTQVLGYLVMENGIYAFGATLATERPMLVEMGILLDVFVAVFIMGIMIFHISREFHHIDTFRLAYLRDWDRSRPQKSGQRAREVRR